MTETTLLAVPNVSEGRDQETIARLARALSEHPGVRLLDVHSDPDHHRSVFTVAGPQNALVDAVMALACQVVERIEVTGQQGVHPRIGALDVAPFVYLHPQDAGAATASALVLADRLGEEVGLPVFLYGALAGGRGRAEVRRGGLEILTDRMSSGQLVPDFGPNRPHARAGAALVGARPPLVAFNLELAPPATLEDARTIATAIRDGGANGLPGVRAIGLWLERRGVAQVSTNVEDPLAVPLARVVESVARLARPSRAELVGLAPRAALEGFPEDLALDGLATIEDALQGAPSREPWTD